MNTYHPSAKQEPRVHAVDSNHRAIDQVRRLEFDVFQRAGYAEGTGDYLEQYAPYDPQSKFYTAWAVHPEGEKLVGVLRLIYRPNSSLEMPDGRQSTGFKTLDDFSLYPEWEVRIQEYLSGNPEVMVEVGTAAVDEQWRGSGVALTLYRHAFLEAFSRGSRYCIASTDAGLLAKFRNDKLFNFEDIGETVHYMGSPTTPVVMDIHTLPDFWKANNPGLYQKMFGESPQ